MIARLIELLRDPDVRLALLCGAVAVAFGLIDALSSARGDGDRGESDESGRR